MLTSADSRASALSIRPTPPSDEVGHRIKSRAGAGGGATTVEHDAEAAPPIMQVPVISSVVSPGVGEESKNDVVGRDLGAARADHYLPAPSRRREAASDPNEILTAGDRLERRPRSRNRDREGSHHPPGVGRPSRERVQRSSWSTRAKDTKTFVHVLSF